MELCMMGGRAGGITPRLTGEHSLLNLLLLRK
jgi:hypothetical protein